MGNLKAIKSKINNNRYSYSFYYYNNQIVTYMIMTDTSFSEEVAVMFLDQLNELFNREVSVDEFNEVQHLPKEEVEGCLQSKFGDSLKGKIMSFKYDEEYEKIKNDGSINILESNVLEFKDTILKAQEQLITRGEKAEVMNAKAEKLTEYSTQFYQSSKKVTKKNCCNKYVIITMTILIVLIVVYGFAVIACKGFLLNKCIN